MTSGLQIKDVERIVVDVPFTPRCQQWNAREIGQWRIVEVIRVTTLELFFDLVVVWHRVLLPSGVPEATASRCLPNREI